MNKFTTVLTIKSDTKYLAPLRGWVASVAKIIGAERFPPRALARITLALIEAVNNAIFHAHKGRAEAQITIELAINEQEVVVEITDQGKGFILEVSEAPALASHGRGLFLIRELMSEVENALCNSSHTLRMVYTL